MDSKIKKLAGEKESTEYYMGLDIGTNSVGWAVTSPNYELLKCKGHKMWGSRLFVEGQTAVERRTHRAARRRLARRNERLTILEELFSKEMAKVDANFFRRLKESKYHLEDKSESLKHLIYTGKDYSDKNFYKDFPTMYHLRHHLMTEGPRDLKQLYIAIHHILKYRGNFLFEGQEFKATGQMDVLLSNFLSRLELEADKFNTTVDELIGILLDNSKTKSDRTKTFVQYYSTNSKTKKKVTALVKLVLGLKSNLQDLLCDDDSEAPEDTECIQLEFSNKEFSEVRADYEAAWGDDIELLDLGKQIYDTIVLAHIKKDGKSLSASKIDSYETHKKQLSKLKELLGEDKDLYSLVFKLDAKGVANYVQYTKQGIVDKTSCSKADFYKFLKPILEKCKDGSIKSELSQALELDQLLPLQRISDNGVIPYQIHLEELEAILEKAIPVFPFLSEVSDGITVAEKIVKTFRFRIPYYIGPLNTSHKANGNAWAVRKEVGKIYPWNFDKKIDKEASAEQFIKNLTNKCTYLVNEDVLPKHSLLYSYFALLNELNNVRKDGKPLDIATKHKLINEVYKNPKGHKKVTKTFLANYLKINGERANKEQITGIDVDIKSDLKSYRDMVAILGENFDVIMAENIIRWVTLFGDSKNMLITSITRTYGEIFSKEQQKKIERLSYKGWGRLSERFLTGLYGTKLDGNGEATTIIQELENTNQNLMQLLSGAYSFVEAVDKWNVDNMTVLTDNPYDLVEEMAVSPAVKRSVWQALKLVNEVSQLRGCKPKKIFVEVARTNRAEKTKKSSRKQHLLSLYKAIGKESSEWRKEIEAHPENEFKSKKLFLYFQQMGRCMYSNEPISIGELFTKAYDIDHIYPRSKTKDDSFDNLVLVKAKENREKTDIYPIEDPIRTRMKSHWELLKNHKLISQRKYDRLVRVDPLTADELSGFIARQLVETNQSVKATTSLLKRFYPDSEIVYTKAENVSDFRHDFDFVKVRSLNNHHHAKDAYLNIVVGNVYVEKFTKNPRNFFDKYGTYRSYNLAKLFENKVSIKRSNGIETIVWDKERDLPVITKMMNSNDVRVTKKLEEAKGALYDGTVYKATVAKQESYISMKPQDIALRNVSKYGGFTKIKIAYYSVYEYYLADGNRVVKMIPITVVAAKTIKNIDGIINYIRQTLGDENITNIRVLIKKLCINSVLKLDGFYYYLGGKTDDRFCIDSAVQLVLPKESHKLLNRIEKFVAALKENKDLEPNSNFITDELLNDLLSILLVKYDKPIYRKLKGNKLEELQATGVTSFKLLSPKVKCQQIMEILNLLTHQKTKFDVKPIGLTASRSRYNFNLSRANSLSVITQSITGLIEKEITIIGE